MTSRHNVIVAANACPNGEGPHLVRYEAGGWRCLECDPR